MAEKITTIYSHINKQLKEEFKKIINRDGDTMKDRLEKLISADVSVHKEGNSQYTIDSWIKHGEDFRGFPAFGISNDEKIKWIQMEKKRNPNSVALKEFWGHTCQWYNAAKEHM